MTTTSTPVAPWDDERLATAFAARAARVRTPEDLSSATIAALRTRPQSAISWRGLLAPAAVVVLAIGAVTGGVALLGGQRGSSALVEFRDGPSADMRTLDAQEFAFDFPADWHAYDASAGGSGISSIAVLGTQPVEPRCGDDRHVDINCVNERRLEPGEIRLLVSTGAYQSGSFKDRPSITNGKTVRLEIGGQVAILDDVEVAGDDYYGATESLHLYIERPGGANQIVLIDLIARDHGSDEILRRMQEVIDSFRFDATAFPSPSDWWTGREAIGLPIISVSDAIAIRDAGVDDHEIAVHGWFSPFGPMSCPYSLATSPVQPVCPDQYIVLMAEPESLVTREANGFSGREPAGPAIQIDLDGLDSGWQPGLPGLGPAQPIEIAVVGHFDDRRSSACPADLLAACRDRFVVDRVHWVNGETKPTSLFDFAPGAGRPFDEAQAVVDVVRPQVTVLSAVHVGGTDLGRIEPTVADRRGGLVQEEAVWIVQVLADRALATYLYVDNTADLYELGVDGATIMAPTSGDPSGPSPTTTVLGAPVISVPDLIARRIGGPAPSPEEVGVRGWMIRSNAVYDCAADPDPHPLVPWCQSPTFLMERPEMLRALTTDGPSVIPVIGPDANIEVEILWQQPTEVIALGHLSDHRWRTCRPEGQDACRRQFVVDRIVPADVVVDELPEPWVITSGASATPPPTDLGTTIASLEARIGAVSVLSAGRLRAADLASIEPQASEIGRSFGDLPMSILRVILETDPTNARTYLLTDDAGLEAPGIAWELTLDGPEELPPPPDPNEATLRPPAAPSTPSPDGTATVELTSQVGVGRPPVRVVVRDQSGLLMSVREVGSSDPPFPGATESGNVYVANGENGEVRLLWIGGVCDENVTITIETDVTAIKVDGGTKPACDAMGVGRELALTFSPAVDAASIDVTYAEHVIID